MGVIKRENEFDFRMLKESFELKWHMLSHDAHNYMKAISMEYIKR